jgi:hypothetical protein
MNPERQQKRAARIMGRSAKNIAAGNDLINEGMAINNNGVIGGGEQLLRRGERQAKRANKLITKSKMKTGGMTNPNAKVSVLKSAGSNGVKSGVNPKAKATGKATGKTGGISKAPKGATPTKNKKK